MRLLRASRLCLIVFCGALLGGCGVDNLFDDPPDLSEVRRFDDHTIYYAGDEVRGYPLEEVLGHVFVYGRCDPPPTGEGDGCSSPVQIHNYDVCDWPPSFNEGPLYDFRGAKARGGGTSIENSMEIFTGRTTVKIDSEDRELTKATAAALRTVHQSQPLSRLPPPAPGSLQGGLPCPDKPGD